MFDINFFELPDLNSICANEVIAEKIEGSPSLKRYVEKPETSLAISCN